MEHEVWTVPLRLRYPFGLSRGTVSELPTVLLRLAGAGLGEAAPVRYLGHTPQALHAAIAALCGALTEADLEDMSEGAGDRALPDAPAPARAAVDIARWDLAARRRGVSLRAHLAARVPTTSHLATTDLATPPRPASTSTRPTGLAATDLTTTPDLAVNNSSRPRPADFAATDLTTTPEFAANNASRPRPADLAAIGRTAPLDLTTTPEFAANNASRPRPADLAATGRTAPLDLAADPGPTDLPADLAASAHTGPGATVTSYTVALDELDAMAERAAEAAHLPLLKVKLGRDPTFDREALRRVAAAAPRARLRVDANGGWTLAQARALLPALADLGVEFVEQPLARGQLDALAELRRHSPLPLYADEDVQGPASLAALRGRVDGINIKLMKCGGISAALAMIAAARREGWRVLIGCMIESRVGLAAAASLADRVDEVDLDAHMLTQGDPVPPGSLRALSPDLPIVPGSGLGVPLRW